jgi:hypothetical protein
MILRRLFRWFQQHQNLRRIAIDVNVLWPAIKAQNTLRGHCPECGPRGFCPHVRCPWELDRARQAFAKHALNDPAWTTELSKLAIESFIEQLQ